MEQEPTNSNINTEFFELPPLKDMKEIISELENSGVADEALLFKTFYADLENDADNSINNVGNSSLIVKEGNLNDEKSEFKLLLNEKDISEIDFEISKDIFEEIKDEDLLRNAEQIALNFGKISYENNEVSGIFPDIDHNEVGLKIAFSENGTVAHTWKENVTDEYSDIKINELPSGMANHMSHENFEEIQFADSEFSPKMSVSKETNKGHEIHIDYSLNYDDIDGSNLVIDENESDSTVNESVFSSSNNEKIAASEPNDIDIFMKNEDEENNISSTKSSYMRTDNNTDSIQAVIESVVQASFNGSFQDLEIDKIDDTEIESVKKEEENPIEEKSKAEREKLEINIPIKKEIYDPFEVVVPLIGKNVMKAGNDKPFNHRYDLAKQRNEVRAKYQQKEGDFPLLKLSYQEWRRQKESRSNEQIEKEKRVDTFQAMQLATAFTKLAIKILHEYEKEKPDEEAMMKYFRYFECAPASPLSLLYAPHFVHTMMLCRGDNDLSLKLRRVANDCYEKCHVLFPIPEGYNFETIYTSEVKKNISDQFDHLDELVLDYGDFDSTDCEDDSASDKEDVDENN